MPARLWSALALCSVSGFANAALITFDTDPFAGSDALTTPGRQVVGGEPSVSFDVANDVFAFDPSVFDIGNDVLFASGLIGDIPTSGVNVVVLQTTDDDGNPATPFLAGTAANLLAAQITADGAGFFIYFNSALDLPRLVYSTNLSEATSDLAILARLTSFAGDSGALATFSAANFMILDGGVSVPEPSTLWLFTLGVAAFAFRRHRVG